MNNSQNNQDSIHVLKYQNIQKNQKINSEGLMK